MWVETRKTRHPFFCIALCFGGSKFRPYLKPSRSNGFLFLGEGELLKGVGKLGRYFTWCLWTKINRACNNVQGDSRRGNSQR